MNAHLIFKSLASCPTIVEPFYPGRMRPEMRPFNEPLCNSNDAIACGCMYLLESLTRISYQNLLLE